MSVSCLALLKKEREFAENLLKRGHRSKAVNHPLINFHPEMAITANPELK
jgi:hypothetical protein